MFPQFPFCYIDNTDFCSLKLLSENKGFLDNSIFSVLRNKNSGVIANDIGINDKILAYWSMDFLSSIETSPSNFTDLIPNQLNPLSPLLAIKLASSPNTPTLDIGLLNNALYTSSVDNIQNAEVAYFAFGGDLSLIDPLTNGFNFFGLSFWLNIDPGSLPSYSSFDQEILKSSTFLLTINIQTFAPAITDPGDPDFPRDADPYVYTLTLTNYYDVSSGTISTTIPNTGWNLIIFEIDIANLTLRLRINTDTPFSMSFTENTFAGTLYDFIFGASSFGTGYSIVKIDEAFTFREPLLDTQVSYLYNSGIGRTYPF